MDTRFHLDPNGRDIAIETIQDVEPILERNHELRREEQRSDWGRHVATIPNVLLVQWLNEAHARGHVGLQLFSDEFERIVQAKLRDPDYAYLRTDRPALQVGW
ncbi:MAG TPA: hypothetical protein VFX37_15150 [Pseudolabrys sp.]|nr:hypothetical protein [Pseudolabrys sp.]